MNLDPLLHNLIVQIDISLKIPCFVVMVTITAVSLIKRLKRACKVSFCFNVISSDVLVYSLKRLNISSCRFSSKLKNVPTI